MAGKLKSLTSTIKSNKAAFALGGSALGTGAYLVGRKRKRRSVREATSLRESIAHTQKVQKAKSFVRKHPTSKIYLRDPSTGGTYRVHPESVASRVKAAKVRYKRR